MGTKPDVALAFFSQCLSFLRPSSIPALALAAILHSASPYKPVSANEHEITHYCHQVYSTPKYPDKNSAHPEDSFKSNPIVFQICNNSFLTSYNLGLFSLLVLQSRWPASNLWLFLTTLMQCNTSPLGKTQLVWLQIGSNMLWLSRLTSDTNLFVVVHSENHLQCDGEDDWLSLWSQEPP